MCNNHRKRIETEDKAMVVATIWGAELVKFLAALALLSRSFFPNRLAEFYRGVTRVMPAEVAPCKCYAGGGRRAETFFIRLNCHLAGGEERGEEGFNKLLC